MSNTDSFIKGAFAISSIVLAVLVILSSVAIISKASSVPGAVIEDSLHENVIPRPAIMIEYPPMTGDDLALAYLQDDAIAIQFIEFPPMHISAQPLLNN